MDNKNSVNIIGKTEFTADYILFAINAILKSRNIFDPNYFKLEQWYGIKLWMTSNPQLKSYLAEILKQISSYIFLTY